MPIYQLILDFINVFKDFIYLFEKERESTREGQSEREREKQTPY